MIRATEANLTKVTDKMIVIPGHGAIGNKSQLASYRDVLAAVRDKVAALKKQGKTLDEIVAAFINTTSIGGRMTLPFNSIYHATKWALEGWSESMAFELNQFGIGTRQ
jgi:NAD(P)-dependent dehydrogenase (short-subunit alcohol dehydrogenase family)